MRLVGNVRRLLTIFLFLELASYRLYLRTSDSSRERGFLYFVIGRLSSRFIFLGVVLSLEEY
jgi:NADH:ubiquinone oxidoreductase subunit 2 (subunit N)